MYDRSSAATGVDEARLHMFARKQRPYDSIPPTQAALREHAKLNNELPIKQASSGARLPVSIQIQAGHLTGAG